MERALYHFEEYDSTYFTTPDEIYSNTMNLFNDVYYYADSDCPKGFCMYFNGTTGSYGSITYSAYFDFYRILQIDFHLKIYELENRTILEKEECFKIEHNNLGNILFSVYIDGAYRTVNSYQNFNLQEVNKVTCQYNGRYLFIYINGLIDNILLYNGTINSNTNDIILGRNSLSSEYTKMRIDELRFKDDLDLSSKIFQDSMVSSNPIALSGTSTNLATVSGHRLNLIQLDPINNLIEGLKELILISNFYQKDFYPGPQYRNIFYDNFNNSILGLNGTIDTENTSAVYNAQYKIYHKGSASTKTIQTINLIPNIYPVDQTDNQTETRDFKNILFVELFVNSESKASKIYYSTNGGEDWTEFLSEKYTQVGVELNDFRIKIVLDDTNADSATTGIRGYAIQIFD